VILDDATSPVYFLPLVTIGTGEDIFGKGRGWYGDELIVGRHLEHCCGVRILVLDIDIASEPPHSKHRGEAGPQGHVPGPGVAIFSGHTHSGIWSRC
jgi:hypothetical protein